jgi:hypothetical protein
VQQVGLVLDIDPEKLDLWKPGLHLGKAALVVTTNTTPFCAKANNECGSRSRRHIQVHEAMIAKDVMRILQ